MIATFASLITRIQQVINACARHGRKMGVVGRSMVNNVKMAKDLGYLSDPAGVLVPLQALSKLPPEETVIIATGSQGEPTSALVRIANNDHRDIKVMPGDTVVISATPIPGNELVVSRTISNLYRQGARVLYDKVALVHVHGHASREELKLMLNITRPKFFVPIHGEFRHLVAHRDIALEVGVKPENAFVLEDGNVLELTKEAGRIAGNVTAGHIYVDGLQLWDMKSLVLSDRRTLSRDGMVVVTLAVEKSTGRVLGQPEAVSSGFVDIEDFPDLMARTAETALRAVNGTNDDQCLDLRAIAMQVKDSVGSFLYEETRLRPLVIPVPVEV